jgi:O-antigen/teichoic acid export membrane protein
MPDKMASLDKSVKDLMFSGTAQVTTDLLSKLGLLVTLRPFDLSTATGRANERMRRILISAVAAAAARGLSVLSALISVPLTFRYLGPERFGVWMIISSFTVLFSFADLGIGNGIMTAIASAKGTDDRSALRSTISSGYFLLTSIAALIMILLAFTYRFIAWSTVFNVHSELAMHEANLALPIFIICFSLTIPAGLVQRIQTGLQEGFHASLWQGLGSVLALFGIVATTYLDGGLHWLVLALFGGPLVAAALNSVIFFGKQHPDLIPRRSEFTFKSGAEIAKLGSLFFVLQLGVGTFYGTDSIMIAHSLGPDSVGAYAVPERMFSIVSTLLAMALMPLWPAYAEASARGDHAWVRRTFLRSMATSVAGALVLSTVLVLSGNFLLGIWVGKTLDPAPLSLMAGFAVWKTIEAAGNTMSIYLNGSRVIRFQVITMAATAISAIALKAALIPSFGIAGAIWSTILPYTLFTLIPCYVFISKRLFWREESSSSRTIELK